jgi:outer membrane protein
MRFKSLKRFLLNILAAISGVILFLEQRMQSSFILSIPSVPSVLSVPSVSLRPPGSVRACGLFSARSAALLLALVLIGALTAAHAQQAGHWSLKIGENLITPKVDSGDLSAPGPTGVKVDVGHAYAPIVSATRMLTDHVATELVLGLPYRHDILGRGSIAGIGKIGNLQQYPPTLFMQYRFMKPTAHVRPYLGLGLTYAYFRDARPSPTLVALLGPTTISVDARWGLTPQLGLIVPFSERWFLDASLSKTFLKTTSTLTSSGIRRVIDSHLDPVAVSLSIGYQF